MKQSPILWHGAAGLLVRSTTSPIVIVNPPRNRDQSMPEIVIFSPVPPATIGCPSVAKRADQVAAVETDRLPGAAVVAAVSLDVADHARRDRSRRCGIDAFGTPPPEACNDSTRPTIGSNSRPARRAAARSWRRCITACADTTGSSSIPTGSRWHRRRTRRRRLRARSRSGRRRGRASVRGRRRSSGDPSNPQSVQVSIVMVGPSR